MTGKIMKKYQEAFDGKIDAFEEEKKARHKKTIRVRESVILRSVACERKSGVNSAPLKNPKDPTPGTN